MDKTLSEQAEQVKGENGINDGSLVNAVRSHVSPIEIRRVGRAQEVRSFLR